MNRRKTLKAISSNIFCFLKLLWTCRVPISSIIIAFMLFRHTPQSRDIFFYISHNSNGFIYLFAFAIAVVLFWILPIYFSSNLAINAWSLKNIVNISPWLRGGIPALLVVSAISSITFGFYYATLLGPRLPSRDGDLQNALWPQEDFALWLPLLLAIFSFGVIRLVIKACDITTTPRRLKRLFWVLSAPLSVPRNRLGLLKHLWPETKPAILVVAIYLLIFIVFILISTRLAEVFPLIYFLPILLGYWIAPLAIVGVIGNKLKIPLIFLLIGIFAILNAVIVWLYPRADRHLIRSSHVRPIDCSSEPVSCKPVVWTERNSSAFYRPTFGDALQLWRQNHRCNAFDESARCPKPIIVIGAGGASRAAFFTSSVLGVLQDATSSDRDNFREFRDQLFAISSVSGSSLGAANFAALSEVVPRGEPASQPDYGCLLKAREFADKDRQWFGVRKWPGEKDACLGRSSCWRDALQILSSGDFLTPTVATWAFRDAMPLSNAFPTPDRSQALEKTVEERLAAALQDCRDMANPLSQPLSSFAPTAKNWRPLLFFNSTSAETGRRVIASTVDPSTDERRKVDLENPNEIVVLYADAYDLTDLMNSRVILGEMSVAETDDLADINDKNMQRDVDPITRTDYALTKARKIDRDISLIRSAVISARFPLITPHASIDNARKLRIDRLVDGGYFETNGALTGVDVVDALSTIMGELYRQQIVRVIHNGLTEKKSEEFILSEVEKYALGADREKNRAKTILSSVKGHIKETVPFLPTAQVAEEVGYKLIEGLGRNRVIEPLVLQITNDPDANRCHSSGFVPDAVVAFPGEIRGIWSALQSAIVSAVLNSRVGRGSHASEILSYQLDDDESGFEAAADALNPGYAHIRVCPGPLEREKYQDLSMSWWLSQPVQNYLHDQICEAENIKQLRRVLYALATKPATREVAIERAVAKICPETSARSQIQVH
jgi:hypothetical protein